MKKIKNPAGVIVDPAPLNLASVVLLAVAASFGTADATAAGLGQTDMVCSRTAKLAFKACGKDVQDNYLIAQGKCLNVTDETEKSACLADAKSTLEDEKSECGDVRDARLELCDALTIGGGPYDPVIDPDNFVADGKDIVGNQYFPLKPGTTWVYQNTDDETITVTVTDQTVVIEGILARLVTDVVVNGDGKTTEDTEDWFAQDLSGNVWYMGESTMAANDEDMLVSVDGSWQAGIDGARPGIVMPAVFTVGEVYRQEWLLGDAEDVAENLSMTESESTPAASCSGNCLKTHEYSPLEPDQSESKFYAPGVGVIVTLDDNNPNFREELVQFTPAP